MRQIKLLVILATVFLTTHVKGMSFEYPDQENYALSSEERNLIERIASTAEQEVRDVLPGLRQDLTLEVRIGPWVPETGIAGAATGPHTIWMMVDPGREESISFILEDHLRTLIFHESHHLVRVWTESGRSELSHVVTERLIDRAVSEGMATAFARDFADGETPWSEYPDNIEDWVSEVLALPDDVDQDAWMFEHPDGREYVGYRVGTYLVDQAIEQSGKSVAELALVPTDEVIRFAQSD